MEKLDFIYSAVKRAIDKWDPYGLLDTGAPKDEFDIENNMIFTQITENSSVEEISAVISAVFSKMFCPEDFPVEKCVEVAKAIYENLFDLRD